MGGNALNFQSRWRDGYCKSQRFLNDLLGEDGSGEEAKKHRTKL